MNHAVLKINLAAEQAMNEIIKGLKEAAKIHTGEAIMKNITINIDGKEIKAQVSEEDIKKLTQKPEWPQNGDKYWYISTLTGPKTSEGLWEVLSFDQSLLEVGNCYRTEQAAKDALRAQKLIAAVAKRRKELNGDWVPEWGNSDKRRNYVLVLDETDHKFSVDSRAYYSQADVFGLYHSIEAVQTITAEFHDELIWYFTEYLKSIN